MNVKFYTTHCPKCVILEEKLKEKKIKYEIVTDEKIMMEKGFKTMPNLEVDGKIMNYLESVKFLNKM
jgi:glutaredoxin-related protein